MMPIAKRSIVDVSGTSVIGVSEINGVSVLVETNGANGSSPFSIKKFSENCEWFNWFISDGECLTLEVVVNAEIDDTNMNIIKKLSKQNFFMRIFSLSISP